MKLVVPSEILENEYRVGITPDCVSALAKMGFKVFVQSNAGINSSYSDDDYKKVGAKISSKLNELYSKADEIGYSIDLTDEAKDFIIDKGYNPKYGARPLERAIQKYIEDVLAEEILSGNVKKGDLVLADYDKKSKEIKITKLDTKKNKQKSK